jgi:hypothetical protein
MPVHLLSLRAQHTCLVLDRGETLSRDDGTGVFGSLPGSMLDASCPLFRFSLRPAVQHLVLAADYCRSVDARWRGMQFSVAAARCSSRVGLAVDSLAHIASAAHGIQLIVASQNCTVVNAELRSCRLGHGHWPRRRLRPGRALCRILSYPSFL